jgi:hypothetical protein
MYHRTLQSVLHAQGEMLKYVIQQKFLFTEGRLVFGDLYSLQVIAARLEQPFHLSAGPFYHLSVQTFSRVCT